MAQSPKTSIDSIVEANRYRAKFSGHGNALGAAGKTEASYDPANCADLQEPGQTIAVSPGPDGFEFIRIMAAWDNVKAEESGLVGKLIKKATQTGVDLDLGCLYELADGTRGCLQAFGKKFGDYNNPPYMGLSGDERTGDARGPDEYILVNGSRWDEIRRLLVYIYIYKGAPNWAEINPRIFVDVPGQDDLVVTLKTYDKRQAICLIGGLENVRGGIKLTNYTEYFPGHAEMDRAFGFGLEWADGKK